MVSAHVSLEDLAHLVTKAPSHHCDDVAVGRRDDGFRERGTKQRYVSSAQGTDLSIADKSGGVSRKTTVGTQSVQQPQPFRLGTKVVRVLTRIQEGRVQGRGAKHLAHRHAIESFVTDDVNQVCGRFFNDAYTTFETTPDLFDEGLSRLRLVIQPGNIGSMLKSGGDLEVADAIASTGDHTA